MSMISAIPEAHIHRAISRLYEAALDPELLPSAFDHVAEVCGSTGITLFPHDADDSPLTYVSHSILEAASEYFTDWLDRCPRVAYARRNPIFDRVFWDGEILDEDTIKTDAYFRDYTRRHDLCFSVVRATTGLHRSARYVFSTPLSLKSGAPDASQIRAFDILSGHAVRALQVYRKLSSTNPVAAGLETLMNHETHGVLIVNAFGNVVHANPVASLLSGRGLSIHKGRPVAATLDGQKSLDALIRKTIWTATEAPEQAPVALHRGSGRKPLLVQAIPLTPSERVPAGGLLRANAGALLLVVDPENSGPRTEQETFRLLGLTATEARIASVLGRGAGPEAAADALDISVGTVRNHMKRIFSKLDISRQSQLVDLAGRLAVLAIPRR